MVFYRMQPAGILSGLPPDINRSGIWELITIVDKNKIDQFIAKYGVEPHARFRHVPDSFARLLIKIAYGQVLCSLDPTDFNPLCLPYILEAGMNYSYVVGGRWDYPAPMHGTGYWLGTNCIKFTNRLLIIVEIRLVANWESPAYHVVVGDVVAETEIARVLSKAHDAGIFEVPPGQRYAKPSDPIYHWMPAQWPLPAWP